MTVGRILANNIDQGSGFALATSHARMSRVVLTAKHVIGDQDPSSLQFLTEDKRRIPVERVEWDSNLDVAVLLLRDAVAEGLAVGLAIEGAAWQVETQPRPNDPKLYGTISDMHRRFVKQDGEHEIYVLQLYEQQNLGDYKGYSGSPVVLKSSTDAVIGVLIEQLRSRLSMQTGLPKPATNVLYAIPIQDVLNRFGLTAVYDMEALRKKYESFKKRVKPAITDKDIEQLIELDPSITSRLFDGSLPLGEPGTRTTIVLLIKAFALKKAVYSEDEANEFLQTVFPEDHLREENPEDARVLDLLKLQQVGPSIPHSDRAMQLGPIFGRNEDIATILRLLQESRLVTLTGAAGIGKTRLALEVKNRLKDTASYSSAYISLASLEPNAPVLPAMIWQLGIPNIGDAASLCEHLLARMQTIENYLLILDNFEHVLTIEAKDVLTTLLERCPKLTILVTSRTILHIEYEQVFSVKPLSVPMAGRIKGSPDLSHYSATALFLYVAQARVSHTPLLITEDAAAKIGDICRMLDGLPLAIRIVASKFSKLSIEEIYEKVLSIEALTLRNEDTELKRQQTLLETFNWSYDLLSPEQQNLFRGLAVFVGGCNYDAAKAVCEKGEEDIGQLIDSSLLEIESIDGASRLYMLRTIYEYAQNKLRDKTFKKQAGALRRRHRNFFLARAVVSENKLRGPEQVACFKQLERDWENIQAALEHTFNEKSACKKLLQFVGGLWWYWRLSVRNRLGDVGWHWLNRLFEHPEVKALGENPLLAWENPKLASLYAKVLYARAAAEAVLIEKPKSWDLIREKLIESNYLYDALDDKEAIAITIVLATEMGRLPDVEARLDLAYELFEEINHVWGMAWVRTHQGCTLIHKGDFEQARSLFVESIRLYRAVEDRHGEWEAEGNLAHLAQIEKITKEGFGEWSELSFVMEQALFARIMLKKFDRNIGWQAYIDPNPSLLSFNYESMRDRFVPSSDQDVEVRSPQPFPRTFRAIVRDRDDNVSSLLDFEYAAAVDLLKWFPDDEDLQDWLRGENLFSRPDHREMTEDLRRNRVVGFMMYPPDIYPDLYVNDREMQVQPDYHNIVKGLNSLANLYLKLRKFEPVGKLYERIIATLEQYCSSENSNLAYYLSQLALFYQGQARYNEAESLLQRALTITEQYLGLAHHDTASVLHDLGMLYFELKAYDKAEPLLLRALTIDEQVFQIDNFDEAIDLGKLATDYYNQQEYAQAELFYLCSLAILKWYPDDEYPVAATVLQNLAMCYIKQRKYTLAESALQHEQALVEKYLGPEDLDMIPSLNTLALLYTEQDQHDRVEPLLQRVLTICERQLDPSDDPFIFTTLNNLAGYYQRQGQNNKAEAYLLRTIALSEQVFGKNHPNLASTLDRLAACYFTQGQYDKAEPLLQCALSIKEQQLGPIHPDVAQCLDILALSYREQGQYTKAESLYQRALMINEQVFGTNHPKVATILYRLSLLYGQQGQYAKAEPLLQRALSINEQQLGPLHPDTIKSLDLLALFYERQQKYEEAERLHKQALSIKEQLSGPDH